MTSRAAAALRVAALLAAWAGTACASSPRARSRDRLDRSHDALVEVREHAGAVARGLEDARRERDLARLACLDEKAERMARLVRVAEQADAALRADGRGLDDAADAELTRLDLARDRALDLRTAAEACAGARRHAVDGRTTVEVEAPRGR